MPTGRQHYIIRSSLKMATCTSGISSTNGAIEKLLEVGVLEYSGDEKTFTVVRL